ncbi:Uma2 family endonuclease [Phormidium sp. FACHB-1136]|uniref:Uma2 family endonuclease n=1 Tax=Phormidium sp. FACHB-1136 TaxID=2692848 RepID=UPI0016828607|nr:Uma2 family endonuclease [Phormidium sp. FACHB-1136]MBD2429557.1 Uma2 family endonuclease [Phormidium sp. FACHB-1136]
MVTANDNVPHLNPDEYLVWEETQPEKYEYIDGEVYAIGGGSVNHGRIAIRLTSLFEAHIEGSPCITGNSDIKVKTVASQNYTYPDASVTCDERDRQTTQYITYPCLIVEVLSESTEAYDRGGKFRLYRQKPVLQDYLLVSSTKIEMDSYHKNEAGDWVIINYQPGDTIELKSIGLSFGHLEKY